METRKGREYTMMTPFRAQRRSTVTVAEEVPVEDYLRDPTRLLNMIHGKHNVWTNCSPFRTLKLRSCIQYSIPYDSLIHEFIVS